MLRRTIIALALIASVISSVAAACADPIHSYDKTKVWSISCLPELQLCLAIAESLVLFLDTEHKPHLLLNGDQPYRVSVLTGRLSYDLPELAHRALTQNELQLLNREGAKVVLEWNVKPPELIACEGIEKALAQLRGLLDLPDPIDQFAAPAPYLQRHSDTQSAYESPAAIFLPATKPQAQFSLRAQSGQSLPVINGSGRTAE